MNDPLVSVIIPTYNSSEYIEKTLNSVFSQSYKNIEVIVIDDGSTDGQNEIIENFRKRHKGLKYFQQANRGVSSARNYGFEKSKGSLIAFLDSDDLWLSDNVFCKVEKFSLGDYGLVHSNGCIIDKDANHIEGTLSGCEGNLLIPMLYLDKTQVPGPSSALIRREIILEVGLFDENLSTSADYDFFLRVAGRCSIGHVNHITWCYRVHDRNMHKNISLMERDMLIVFEKVRLNQGFESKAFERYCFSKLYLMLAANWAGDGRNLEKGIKYSIKAICKRPTLLLVIIKKIVKKWFRN